ncbi:MAG: TIGR01621 family pseudouridine synthase [Gammaproteobacteria bacterium]|nr:TIGR01621 family pseudouridine synthase [Gammaproteobacteria bacterium]MDH5629784.1 TIGR01621 family pseudouridine synthase [Gammaproteobacteria bacterium]
MSFEPEIIDQNDDFIVINKPANISFHSENYQAGLFASLESSLNTKLWPVHRLDKITSGLIILAKSAQAAAELGQLFETRQIKKTYLAISDKKPNKKQGKIVGDMTKSRSGGWKLLQSKENPSITHFYSHSLVEGKRLFLILPETGKTHQIRVALKANGSPVLGDERYSNSKADRGYLHAYRLDFEWKGKPIQFECLPNQGEFFLLPEFDEVLGLLDKSTITPSAL